MNIKVYIGELLPNIKHLELLNPNLGFIKRKNIFGDSDIFDNYNSKILDTVENVNDADYILIPYEFSKIQKNKNYLKNIFNLVRSINKKAILFTLGDNVVNFKNENIILFKNSEYLSKIHSNNIIAPAYAADLSYGNNIKFRRKSVYPIISFCGWAGVPGFYSKIKYFIKNYLILKGPYKQGIYFRRKAIKILNKSKLVKTNFIIRDSYSANAKTIKIDPKIARKEYIDNIINSDFVLCPKGDGNFSVRFYEVLSLGRIPILIDTDMILPLNKDIDYSKFILRINYKDIHNIDKIVSDFYNKITEDEWIKMQSIARQEFVNHLNIVSFFKFILTKENIEKYIK